jgi:vacuolar-type H+-ATPase subunit H
MPQNEVTIDENVISNLFAQGLAPVDSRDFAEDLDQASDAVQPNDLQPNDLQPDEVPDDETSADLTEPIEVMETPGAAATRVLEIATVTADQLVAEAKAEAAALVAAAQIEAAELLATITAEVEEVASDLARRTNTQNAELEHERTTALAQLGEEKGALQKEIDALGKQEDEHRTRLRDYLNGQLALLGDDEAPEAPVAVAS